MHVPIPHPHKHTHTHSIHEILYPHLTNFLEVSLLALNGSYWGIFGIQAPYWAQQVGRPHTCFSIADASWYVQTSQKIWKLNCIWYKLSQGIVGLRFHEEASFSLLGRSMIPPIKGTRSQCLWTPLHLQWAPLKTVCMMSRFRTILLGSRFEEKAPELWCKHSLFGSMGSQRVGHDWSDLAAAAAAEWF